MKHLHALDCAAALCIGLVRGHEELASHNDSLYLPSMDNALPDMLANASISHMPPCGRSGFILEEATIDDMQTAMAQGMLSSEQLVQCYLDRIWVTQPYIK